MDQSNPKTKNNAELLHRSKTKISYLTQQRKFFMDLKTYHAVAKQQSAQRSKHKKIPQLMAYIFILDEQINNCINFKKCLRNR